MAEKETHKKAGGIGYVLYRRPLHPEFFDIRASRIVEETYYRAVLWIIGHSHVVTVTTEEGALAELVTEQDREIPRRGILKRVPIHDRGLDRIRLSDGGIISYTSEFSFSQHTPASYREQHDAAFVGSFDQRLLYTYEPEGKEGLRPFTLMDYRAERGRLLVRTINAYPQDLVLVTTDSTFEM